MPWIFLVALVLLLLKGFQWLQHLQLPLPALLAGGMGLAVLSNLGLRFPALTRLVSLPKTPLAETTPEDPQIVAATTPPATEIPNSQIEETAPSL